MNIATGWSTVESTQQAITEAYESLTDKLGQSPTYIVAYTSISYPVADVLTTLQDVAPEAQIHGSSSCQGAMTEAGYHSDNGRGLALLGIVDEAGDIGVGSAEIGDDAVAAGRQAMLNAIMQAGRMGEPPMFVWLSGVPGHEEALLEGMQSVIGDRVPIAGGSSADDTVEGKWYQFTHEQHYDNAVIVSAVYPSRPVYRAFHSGYSATRLSGRVTRADGRTLQEIDGKPAAQVYNQWGDGVVAKMLPNGGNVLATTTLNPLGRKVGSLGDVPYYRLAHPDTVTPEGGLTLFADISEGDEIIMMQGTHQSLVSRAGHVAQSALDSGRLAPDDVCGSLVIYCAGCMLTVQEDMDRVSAEINQVLGSKPFIGAFTFGEQGCFVGGENHHGNLMISIVTFQN